jgi:alpha-ribazole phosphatase/probable phosphoglycerate mutase
MTRLIFVRHGQSTDNADGVFANRPPGAGLTALGRAQAQSATESLRESGTVLVASHVGTLTIGLLSLCPNLTSADVWGTALPHATAIVVDDIDGTWSCRSWPGAAGAR